MFVGAGLGGVRHIFIRKGQTGPDLGGRGGTVETRLVGHGPVCECHICVIAASLSEPLWRNFRRKLSERGAPGVSPFWVISGGGVAHARELENPGNVTARLVDLVDVDPVGRTACSTSAETLLSPSCTKSTVLSSPDWVMSPVPPHSLGLPERVVVWCPTWTTIEHVADSRSCSASTMLSEPLWVPSAS